MLVALETLDN